MSCNRNGNRWTTPEVLALQREFELLEMNIFDIANKHKRNAKGIAYKLYNEDLITDMCLQNYLQEIKNNEQNEQVTSDDSLHTADLSESIDLQNRITHLEENIKDISNTIKQLLQERKSPERMSSSSPVRSLRCNSHLLTELL